MKKLIIVLATGALFIGMSSCTKDYDCTCVTTDPIVGSTTNISTVKGTKKTSETLCDAGDITIGSGDAEVKTECSIN
ncbi:MAG: hypothetical protein ACJASM_000611 [Salibacteraceae bacterium]|jgi:hypothetical protein|tara:strand:+ start:452 stop:682 length:231 start_codon:yes stop_codon:yes gene_type:complete